jgi:prolyl 4-hydroxylase
MLQVVPAFWDAKEQEFEGSDEAEALWEGTYDYMTDVVATGAEYDAVRDECQNRHERCTLWATKGECEANPRFMKVQCAPACRSCEMLDVRRRCPVDPNDRDLFQEGDLDRMYERIVRDFSVYEPQVLSRPGGDPDDDPSIVDGPWMVTLENFVGDEEANELIAAAHSVGFQPSTEFIQKEDGTYERQVTKTRTSMGVFCFDECLRDHPITMQFSETIEKLTGAPRNHTTFPQFLKYEEGQSFHKHSDFDPRHLDLQHGGRIMTILTYLSDVEEGGETHFPYLNITVTPRRGRIVLFPLVMNGDPNEEDVRTHHEGQKIKSGVKYAVSMYVHQKDFKNTWRKGCIG